MREKNFLNVYQLTFLPGIFPINSFIYETKDSLLVIDIGTKYFVRHIQTLSKTHFLV